jgi:hypothetical protein
MDSVNLSCHFRTSVCNLSCSSLTLGQSNNVDDVTSSHVSLLFDFLNTLLAVMIAVGWVWESTAALLPSTSILEWIDKPHTGASFVEASGARHHRGLVQYLRVSHITFSSSKKRRRCLELLVASPSENKICDHLDFHGRRAAEWGCAWSGWPDRAYRVSWAVSPVLVRWGCQATEAQVEQG